MDQLTAECPARYVTDCDKYTLCQRHRYTQCEIDTASIMY